MSKKYSFRHSIKNLCRYENIHEGSLLLDILFFLFVGAVIAACLYAIVLLTLLVLHNQLNINLAKINPVVILWTVVVCLFLCFAALLYILQFIAHIKNRT